MPEMIKTENESFALPIQKGTFNKSFRMRISVDDLQDQSRFRHLLTISYSDIISFVIDYITRRTSLTVFFWSVCMIFFGISVIIRVNLAGIFELKRIITHTLLGLVVFPVVIIPVHEGLHILPYFIAGARKIKIGMDLNQYIFYVTAHRHVVTPRIFRIVALIPFVVISLTILFLVLWLPGLWKWSLSLFLFVHATMCAGDFAMLNYYHINKSRKIYTWDDADLKEAYFYEEL
jgi:Putative zincin peptidase